MLGKDESISLQGGMLFCIDREEDNKILCTRYH